MDITLLDNPRWHALNSHQRHLAVWGKIAVRYQPGVLNGAALPDSTPEGFLDLISLVEQDETIGLLGTKLPAELPGWQVVREGLVPQMVCEQLKPASLVEPIGLTTADVPDMLELVALTQPGPFLPRTIEMGQYLGLRQGGRLVAMAGERLHITGFCEISAVCTHPEYRRRGYGSGLTTMVTEAILARGETPFLHLLPGNTVAMRLYEKMGFRLRKEIEYARLQRLGQPSLKGEI